MTKQKPTPAAAYRVVVWGQKGQRAGVRVLLKKQYARLGSARAFALKHSEQRNVNWVDLFEGDTQLARFAKGESDPSYAAPDAGGQLPLVEPTATPATPKKAKRAAQKATRAAKTSDGAARYKAMIEKNARVQHFAKYGIDRGTAAAIRASVRGLAKPTAEQQAPRRAAAASKPRTTSAKITLPPPPGHPDSRQPSRDGHDRIIADALRALIRERSLVADEAIASLQEARDAQQRLGGE